MTATTDNLYRAFYQRMLAEPEEAHEIIKGERTWPPVECDRLNMGDALWNLELDAVDFAEKATALAKCFSPRGVDSTWLIQIRAARDAIMAIRQKHIEDTSAPDPFEDWPSRQPNSRGWSSVLR